MKLVEDDLLFDYLLSDFENAISNKDKNKMIEISTLVGYLFDDHIEKISNDIEELKEGVKEYAVEVDKFIKLKRELYY